MTEARRAGNQAYKTANAWVPIGRLLRTAIVALYQFVERPADGDKKD